MAVELEHQDPAKRRLVLGVIRPLWLIAVVAAVIWLIRTQGEEMARYAGALSLPAVFASIGCILFGKLLVVLQMRIALAAAGKRLPFREALYVYSVSDIAKYLPGGVWSIVGRAALYSARGMSPRQTAVALLLENGWLVTGAILIGTSLSAPHLEALAQAQLGMELPSPYGTPLLMGCVVILLVFGMAALERLIGTPLSKRRTLTVLALQILTWCSLGLSFGVLVGPEFLDSQKLLASAGAFCLAFGVGFFAVFAPAGLGVRESMTTLLLYPMLPMSALLAMNLVSRLLWLICDAGFAVVSWALYKARSRPC